MRLPTTATSSTSGPSEVSWPRTTSLVRAARAVSVIAAISLLGVACGSSSGEDETISSTSSTTSATTSEAPTTTEAPVATTTPPEETTSTTEPASAIDLSGDKVLINWGSLASEPYYAPPSSGADPFYHIHTDPDIDGFFLSFELYTTGYGNEWTGETGTFDISCSSATASTGICPYFDPDGPGPIEVLGSDFAATGSMTIVHLDGDGYELIVHDLVFSDGTSFEEFTLTG